MDNKTRNELCAWLRTMLYAHDNDPKFNISEYFDHIAALWPVKPQGKED